MITKRQIKKARATKLTTNFTLWEAIRSADHPVLVEMPSKEIIIKIKLGAEMVVQPVRTKFGKTKINSWYRNCNLNRTVGSNRFSDHPDAAAIDLVPKKADLLLVFGWMCENIPYRQIILYKKSGFIHCSWNHAGKKYKHEILVFNK